MTAAVTPAASRRSLRGRERGAIGRTAAAARNGLGGGPVLVVTGEERRSATAATTLGGALVLAPSRETVERR